MFEEFCKTNFKSFCNFLYIFQGNIFLGSLNHADISPMNSCTSGKFLLGKVPFQAFFPNFFSKSDIYVVSHEMK